MIGIQSFLIHLEYFTNQRESVGMYTGRSHTDQHIAVFYLASCDHIFAVNHANCKTSQIVFILRHKSRMLCCLTTDQRCAGLVTSFCYTFYDLSNLLRIVFAAGNIIQEKQRLAACAGNIVYAHCNCIDSDGIMFVH